MKINAKVRRNFESRISIELYRSREMVKHVVSDDQGVRVRRDMETVYDHDYNRLLDYPAAQACENFVRQSYYTGITKEAQKYLDLIVNPSSTDETEEEDMVQKKTVKKKEAGKKDGTAAQMFQTLIMEGKLNDDQIFKRVKAVYGLDDKKRGYVGWYRNYLKKQGKNLPTTVKKGGKHG